MGYAENRQETLEKGHFRWQAFRTFGGETARRLMLVHPDHNAGDYERRGQRLEVAEVQPHFGDVYTVQLGHVTLGDAQNNRVKFKDIEAAKAAAKALAQAWVTWEAVQYPIRAATQLREEREAKAERERKHKEDQLQRERKEREEERERKLALRQASAIVAKLNDVFADRGHEYPLFKVGGAGPFSGVTVRLAASLKDTCESLDCVPEKPLTERVLGVATTFNPARNGYSLQYFMKGGHIRQSERLYTESTYAAKAAIRAMHLVQLMRGES